MNEKIAPLAELLTQVFLEKDSGEVIFRQDFRKLIAVYRCGASSEEEELSCIRHKPNGKGCCYAVQEFGIKICHG